MFARERGHGATCRVNFPMPIVVLSDATQPAQGDGQFDLREHHVGVAHATPADGLDYEVADVLEDGLERAARHAVRAAELGRRQVLVDEFVPIDVTLQAFEPGRPAWPRGC